jgi:beta-hydroxylase
MVFHPATEFSFLAPLQAHWKELRDEFYANPDAVVPWFEGALHSGKWKGVMLAYKGNLNAELLGNYFPTTAKLLAQVPQLYIAGFSLLEAGGEIFPHVGYSGDVWRAHLGLDCPEDCWINVAGEEQHWRDGEMFVFDDTAKHFAKNNSNRDRLVLIVDFYKQRMAA